MSNPYQTPAFDPQQFRDQPAYAPGAVNDYGWVSQVRIFAILNAIQGLLEIPMGLFISGMGVALPAMMRWDKAKNPNSAQGPIDDSMLWFITGLYLVIGIPVLISGIVRIAAGWQNYHFKGRILSLVSIIAGMATMFSCYCAPTAIGLLVYGLILHLNPAVKAAFDMGCIGRSADQILAAFNPYQPTVYGFATPAAPRRQPPFGDNPFGTT